MIRRYKQFHPLVAIAYDAARIPYFKRSDILIYGAIAWQILE